MVLRCTAGLRRVLGVSARDLVEVEPGEDDWYADTIELGSRPGLIAIHAGTLFAVCIPRLRAAELAEPGAAVSRSVAAALDAERLPSDALGPLDARELRIAKTASRSIVGHLQESIRTVRAAVDAAGGVTRVDAAELAAALQRTIRFVDRDAVYALETVRERAGGSAAAIDRLVLRVELEEMPAPVWRELALPADASLADLQAVLLAAFGWEDSHLSEFRTQGAWRGQSYQVRLQIEFGSRGVMPAEQVAVGELLGAPRARLWWIYDFGDEWTHRITCKRCDTASEGGARCLGGAHGYEALLEALADAAHPEQDEMVEWIGGPCDPDAFDVDAIDRAVRRLRVGLVD